MNIIIYILHICLTAEIIIKWVYMKKQKRIYLASALSVKQGALLYRRLADLVDSARLVQHFAT